MFGLYAVRSSAGGHEFRKVGNTSLAGVNSGLVAKYLKTIVTKNVTEPYQWHIDVGNALQTLRLAKDADALVIDAKPNGKEVQLFRLLDIWGHSASGWTPIMLKMRLLTEESVDKERFVLKNMSEEDVYTFLYLRGTVRQGRFEGRWVFPGASPTNSVFLWPETLRYFVRAAGLAMGR